MALPVQLVVPLGLSGFKLDTIRLTRQPHDARSFRFVEHGAPDRVRCRGTFDPLTFLLPRGQCLNMKAATRDQTLETELTAMLLPMFPGITVSVEHSNRWDRPCATFRWKGFKGLLPEERFHRLVNAMPEGFRKSRLKGIVWLELAPGESTDVFLKLPRSEDVADREVTVYADLRDSGFFESLQKTLGGDPQRNCPGDFSKSEAVLSAKKFSVVKRRDAKLVFIRHGAYCDCQVIQSVRQALEKAST